MTTTSDTDVCPRCGGGFHCGVHDDTRCACTTITLSAATLAELRTQYAAACLCLRCLAELAADEKKPADLTTGRL